MHCDRSQWHCVTAAQTRGDAGQVGDVAIGLDEGVGTIGEAIAVLPASLCRADDGRDLIWVESRGLLASYSSCARAREFTRRVARRWQFGELAEDLATVVSELVANALDHGLGLASPAGANSATGPSTAAETSEGPCPIELGLLRTGSRVVCLVSDPATQPPRRVSPDIARESGRGLQLIDSISVCWGWAPLRRGVQPGKAVWAALAVPDRAGRPAEAVAAVNRATG
jgi:hypothetical protein